MAPRGDFNTHKEDVVSDATEFDWNKAKIWNADGDDVPLTPRQFDVEGMAVDLPPYSVQVHSGIGEIATVTGNLEQALAHKISNCDFVLGCFAWLTNYRVLDALARLTFGCQIVVQKEDFLRPDHGHTAKSHRVLRQKYERLRCRFSRYELPSIASGLSVGSDDLVEAVRCAGVANSERRIAAPRMHHKFAVFCECNESVADRWPDSDRRVIVPKSVWTGSFNPTSNGTRSRENAVVIESESVAKFYADEWAKVLAMSEPLDWSSKWSAPEWRIGT